MHSANVVIVFGPPLHKFCVEFASALEIVMVSSPPVFGCVRECLMVCLLLSRIVALPLQPAIFLFSSRVYTGENVVLLFFFLLSFTTQKRMNIQLNSISFSNYKT